MSVSLSRDKNVTKLRVDFGGSGTHILNLGPGARNLRTNPMQVPPEDFDDPRVHLVLASTRFLYCTVQTHVPCNHFSDLLSRCSTVILMMSNYDQLSNYRSWLQVLLPANVFRYVMMKGGTAEELKLPDDRGTR